MDNLDIVVDQIIPNLSLSEVYAYCQAQQGNPNLLRLCNSGSFWKRLGRQRFPTIFNQQTTSSSIGQRIKDVARLMMTINSILNRLATVEIIFDDVEADTLAPFGHQVTSNLELDIHHLTNGQYYVEISLYDDSGIVIPQQIKVYLSEDQLGEYLFALSDQSYYSSSNSILDEVMADIFNQYV